MYTNIICNHGYHVIYFHIQLVQKNLVILEEIFAALDKIPQYFWLLFKYVKKKQKHNYSAVLFMCVIKVIKYNIFNLI
jgi:hypothetical protein